MSYSSILVLSDNEKILNGFVGLLENNAKLREGRTFTFSCHPKHQTLIGQKIGLYTVMPLNIKEDYKQVTDTYDLVISAHCKQIFPPELVNNVKCINIHPGYNPYNRGWYPQVFSIINGKPLGATIHEIDEELDHGKIIAQEKVEIKPTDTSLTAYNRVQEKELQLLESNLESILSGNYQTLIPEGEGNTNFKKDFEALRQIPLDEKVTFKQAIDFLRAMTHAPFKNTYFIDPKTHERIWVEISLKAEPKEDHENEA